MSSNESLIIALTETWLTPSVVDAEISLNNFTVFRADRVETRRGGGVALYIKFPLCQLAYNQTSKLLLVLQAFRRAATTQGECLIVGDFYAITVGWPNRTSPNSCGPNSQPPHYCRGRISLSVYPPAHTLPDGEPVGSVGLCAYRIL